MTTPMTNPILESQLKNVSLLVYDFDGVMTDNTVYVDQEGREMVRCHRGDGLAISLLKERSLQQLILSTETNPVVTVRGKKCGIPVIQGAGNKKEVLERYCKDHGVELKEVLYIGNDLNDLEVLGVVGIKCCPMDAVDAVLAVSDIVIQMPGGSGVIRALYDILT